MMNKLIAFAALGFTSLSALAGPPAPVPAPETLPLLAIGAVSGLAGWFLNRNRRK